MKEYINVFVEKFIKRHFLIYMTTLTVSVNPKVLRWARETAHLEFLNIPKSIIKEEKLLKIESGKALPTLPELERLSRKYDRPLSLLMSNETPRDDYSKLPFFRQKNKTDYDSALALFIRDIQKKQDWARNYLISEGYNELNFIGSVKISDNIKKVANKIKNRLKLPSASLFKSNKDFFKNIKNTLENENIFVSITGSDKTNRSIGLEQSRGFAIVDKFAPFIFVNTKDTPNANIFTIMHEVVHLFLNESGISQNTIKLRKPVCNEDRIENFCNLVASEILMPENIFLQKRKDHFSLDLRSQITNLSNDFLVSELAICVRLQKLNLIDYETYNKVYLDIQKDIINFLKLQKKSKGGNYYANMRFKNGVLLSKLALSAYKDNQILGTDLFNLLKVKIHNLDTYFSAI